MRGQLGVARFNQELALPRPHPMGERATSDRLGHGVPFGASCERGRRSIGRTIAPCLPARPLRCPPQIAENRFEQGKAPKLNGRWGYTNGAPESGWVKNLQGQGEVGGGAGRGGRTPTGRSPREFESRASASSASPARLPCSAAHRGCQGIGRASPPAGESTGFCLDLADGCGYIAL